MEFFNIELGVFTADKVDRLQQRWNRLDQRASDAFFSGNTKKSDRIMRRADKVQNKILKHFGH